MTEVQKWADWAYSKEDNMRHIMEDPDRYRPEAARLTVHLALGSSEDEALPSCISPKVEIFVNGKLWRSTEEWKR